jgi:hypothetical protein
MIYATLKNFILFILLVLIPVVYACAPEKSISKWHPADVTAPVICSECHKDGRDALDHSSDFITRHKLIAAQQGNVCIMCHKESFCADCHAHKEELAPSDKYKGSPQDQCPTEGITLLSIRSTARSTRPRASGVMAAITTGGA